MLAMQVVSWLMSRDCRGREADVFPPATIMKAERVGPVVRVC